MTKLKLKFIFKSSATQNTGYLSVGICVNVLRYVILLYRNVCNIFCNGHTEYSNTDIVLNMIFTENISMFKLLMFNKMFCLKFNLKTFIIYFVNDTGNDRNILYLRKTCKIEH